MSSNVPATRTNDAEVLQLLGLPPNHIHSKALLLLANRYGLDPLLKEIVVIPGRGPFVGVKGAVGVALRSGLLDGMEADDTWETDTHWCVRCIVWRKDMSHPAAKVIGRVAKTEKKEWPLEIARARAVRAALSYAFNIHDDYGSSDDQYEPPPDTNGQAPDERIQATVIDVPAAASPREEASAQPAAKPKKRVTKAARGSAADPDPTPGHTGVSSGPPPGSPAADPRTPGAAATEKPPADTSTEPAAPDQPTLDTDPPTLIVGGHILAQKLAIAARHAGIDDDQTRHDVITAATSGAATRGHDVTEEQAPRVLAAFAGLADGSVELRYKPDGTPALVRPRRP